MHSNSQIETAIHEIKEAAAARLRVKDKERAKREREIRILSTFHEAAHFAVDHHDVKLYCHEWVPYWKRVADVLRDDLRITTVANLKVPEGRGFKIARLLLESLVKGEPLEKFENDLVAVALEIDPNKVGGPCRDNAIALQDFFDFLYYYVATEHLHVGVPEYMHLQFGQDGLPAKTAERVPPPAPPQTLTASPSEPLFWEKERTNKVVISWKGIMKSIGRPADAASIKAMARYCELRQTPIYKEGNYVYANEGELIEWWRNTRERAESGAGKKQESPHLETYHGQTDEGFHTGYEE